MQLVYGVTVACSCLEILRSSSSSSALFFRVKIVIRLTRDFPNLIVATRVAVRSDVCGNKFAHQCCLLMHVEPLPFNPCSLLSAPRPSPSPPVP